VNDNPAAHPRRSIFSIQEVLHLNLGKLEEENMGLATSLMVASIVLFRPKPNRSESMDLREEESE
jgi:hypothetical protein